MTKDEDHYGEIVSELLDMREWKLPGIYALLQIDSVRAEKAHQVAWKYDTRNQDQDKTPAHAPHLESHHEDKHPKDKHIEEVKYDDLYLEDLVYRDGHIRRLILHL